MSDEEERAERIARRESGGDAILPALGDADTGTVNSENSDRDDLSEFQSAIADLPEALAANEQLRGEVAAKDALVAQLQEQIRKSADSHYLGTLEASNRALQAQLEGQIQANEDFRRRGDAYVEATGAETVGLKEKISTLESELEEATRKIAELEIDLEGQILAWTTLEAELTGDLEAGRTALSSQEAEAASELAAVQAATDQIRDSLTRKVEELEILAAAAQNLKPEALVDIYGEDSGIMEDDASAASRKSTSARDARRRSILTSAYSPPGARDVSEQFLQMQISMPAGAAAGSRFAGLSAKISALSDSTMSITGGETGGEIPLVGLTPTARATMEDKISKALKGKITSKAAFQNLGGLPHMIVSIRVAFREVGRDHLASLFRFHTIEDIMAEHHRMFGEEKTVRVAAGKLDAVRHLGTIWHDDQALIFAAVAAIAAPLSAPIKDQVEGTTSAGHGAKTARDLPMAGYLLFGMAERELVDVDAHMLWVRLQEIMELPKFYKSRFRGNFQYFVEEVSKTLHTFALDFGPVTPVMLQHALLVPIMLRLKGGSEEEWRKKLKTLSEWDEAAAEYQVLVHKMSPWANSLMDYQRDNHKALYAQQPMTKGAHAQAHNIKQKGELTLFARVDTATNCSECGQKHGSDVPCLTAANMKRLLDELVPQTALLKSATKELSKTSAGGATANACVAKLNAIVRALEACAFGKGRGARRTAGPPWQKKDQSVNKIEDESAEAGAREPLAHSPEAVKQFSTALQGIVQSMVAKQTSPGNGGGSKVLASGATYLRVEHGESQQIRTKGGHTVVIPKGMELGTCYDNTVQGRTCAKGADCKWNHANENTIRPIRCTTKGCKKPVIPLRDQCSEHAPARKPGGQRQERTTAAAESDVDVKSVEDLMSLLVKVAPEMLHLRLTDEDDTESVLGLGPDSLGEVGQGGAIARLEELTTAIIEAAPEPVYLTLRIDEIDAWVAWLQHCCSGQFYVDIRGDANDVNMLHVRVRGDTIPSMVLTHTTMNQEEEGQGAMIGLGPDHLPAPPLTDEASLRVLQDPELLSLLEEMTSLVTSSRVTHRLVARTFNRWATVWAMAMPSLVPSNRVTHPLVARTFTGWAMVKANLVFTRDDIVHHRRRKQAARDKAQSATKASLSRVTATIAPVELVAAPDKPPPKASKWAANRKTAWLAREQRSLDRAAAEVQSRWGHEVRRRAQQDKRQLERARKKERLRQPREAVVPYEKVSHTVFARLAGLRDDDAPLGLQWRKICQRKVKKAQRASAEFPLSPSLLGKEVTHPRLAKALQSKSSFTLSAWLELQVDDVCSESYIKSGESYFQPVPTRAGEKVQSSIRARQNDGKTLLEARKEIKDDWIKDFQRRVGVARRGGCKRSVFAGTARAQRPRFGKARARHKLVRVWAEVQAAAAYDQRDDLWELWANTQFSKDHCDNGIVPGSVPDVVLDEIWQQLGLQGQTVTEWVTSMKETGLVERLKQAETSEHFYRRYTMAQLGVVGEELGVTESDSLDGSDSRGADGGSPSANLTPTAAGGEEPAQSHTEAESSHTVVPIATNSGGSDPEDETSDASEDFGDDSHHTSTDSDEEEPPDLEHSSSDEEESEDGHGEDMLDASHESEAASELSAPQEIANIVTRVRGDIAGVLAELSMIPGQEARCASLRRVQENANPTINTAQNVLDLFEEETRAGGTAQNVVDRIAAATRAGAEALEQIVIETRVEARAAGVSNAQTEHLCDICLNRHEPHVACIKPANDGDDDEPTTQQKQATAAQGRVASCRVLDDHAGDADCDSDDSDEAGCCGQLASWFTNAVTRQKRTRKRSAEWERTGLKGRHASRPAPAGARGRSWEPMSTASMLRGMRLADIVRAHVLMDDDGGVFLQQVLKDFKPKKVPGILYWLADTGSTCFVSDEPEHVLCAEECLMNITGVGATVCNLRSQLIITTMDTQGCYNTMQYGKCYNTKNGVGFPIASTGAMERNGCRFDINEDRPQYITAGKRTIPLVTDSFTGFHFIVEHVRAAPSIALRAWCVRQSLVLHHDKSHVTHFRGTPTMYQAEAEKKPTIAYATSIQAGEVAAQCRGSRAWSFGKRVLKSNQLTKEWIDGETVAKRSRDIDGNKHQAQTHVKTEVKAEKTDDAYAKEVRKAGEDAGFKKPIRLKLPALRLADTGQSQDIQKLQKYIHELFGHLELRTIFNAIDHIEGAEIMRILKVVVGFQGGSDAHCDSCAQNKLAMPGMPRGKTERPAWIREVPKVYCDILGYVREASVFHNYHFALAAVTDKDYAEVLGLAFRAQALLGMAKIFSRLGGMPGEIQIDGESTLNTESAKTWMSGKGAGRSSKVTVTEAYAQWRNGKIERRWRTWKTMARCMIARAGMAIGWWYHALKFAVTVTNIVNMVTDDTDQLVTVDGKDGKGEDAKIPMTAWEMHFGEKPRLQEILLGPFGSLAYLILSEEQRRARGQSGSFGVRAIVGLYLGPEVDAKTGVYHHLVTDGKTIYASPNNVKIIPDVYPAEFSPEREGTAILGRDERVLIGLEEPDGTEATARDFYERAYLAAIREQRRDEQERVMFAKQDGEKVCAARKAAAKGNASGGDSKRLTGQGKKKPYQVASGKLDGGPDARAGETMDLGDDPNKVVNFEKPEDYQVTPLADEYIFEEAYAGSKYKIAVPRDFKNEKQVGTPLAHPHDRFVGRRVRKAFTVVDKKGKEVARNFEGKVVNYAAPRQLFKVHYDDGDREEYDFEQLMELLIMGAQHGDLDEDCGNTRAERVEALKVAALYLETREELWAAIQTKAEMHAHDAYDRYEESMSELVQSALTSTHEPGTLHVPVTDGKVPIYDDEPNNPKELDAHPEKKEILASAGAEMRQLIEMDIGVLQSPKQVDELIREGVKILRSRMIYKRKYALSKTTNREEFLKWKSRLAVNGAGQTEGVDTVWNTFSPTIGFAAIRTLLATLCNPKFVTESFDLSGAFLGTKLEDHAVYVRLPGDAGDYANRVLRLTKAVYGCKFSGAAFMKQLGDEVMKFEEKVVTTVTDSKGKKSSRVEYAKFERLMSDQCIYRYTDSEGREMIFLSYVDDIICSTTCVKLRDRFFEHLQKTWKITKEGTLDRFLAVNFSQSKDKWSWRANMSSYISKIAARFGLTETRQYKTPMEPGFHLVEADFDVPPTEDMKTEMRSLIGSIGYATVALRYDTAYAVSVLSRYLAKPCKKVIDAAKRVIMYLMSTHDFYLEWRSSDEEIERGVANILVGAVDASFAADAMTRRSHGGYINFINSGPVSWKSGLQPIVTLSSCESEYVALCAEVCEVKYLRNLIGELGYEQKEATLIWEDNKAAILIAEQTGSSAGRCKHIDTRFRFVSEAIKDRVVRVRYTPTDTNVADLFTKPLSTAVFERLLELCRSTKSAQYGNVSDDFQVATGAAYFMVEGC